MHISRKHMHFNHGSSLDKLNVFQNNEFLMYLLYVIYVFLNLRLSDVVIKL